jgi:hypothetical protein
MEIDVKQKSGVLDYWGVRRGEENRYHHAKS